MFLESKYLHQTTFWGTFLGWSFIENLRKINSTPEDEGKNRSWIDEWSLGRIMVNCLQELALDENQGWQVVQVTKILTLQHSWFEKYSSNPLDQILTNWLGDADIQQYLGINRYKDVLWFNKERFEDFLWWMMFLTYTQTANALEVSYTDKFERIIRAYELIRIFLQAESGSNFQVEKLLNYLRTNGSN